MRLEVPVIVRLGERSISLREVVGLVPGTILELPKNADEELDLLVNNQPVGKGLAVKVGENFGVRVTAIGSQSDRVAALGKAKAKIEIDDDDLDEFALAEKLLADQL